MQAFGSYFQRLLVCVYLFKTGSCVTKMALNFLSSYLYLPSAVNAFATVPRKRIVFS